MLLSFLYPVLGCDASEKLGGGAAFLIVLDPPPSAASRWRSTWWSSQSRPRAVRVVRARRKTERPETGAWVLALFYNIAPGEGLRVSAVLTVFRRGVSTVL